MHAGWVVLRTRARCELLAAQAVRAKGVESFVPMLRASQRAARPRPLFPGYLFARIQAPAEQLPRVRSASGVAYVLPRAAPPAVLPDGLVEAGRIRAGKPVDDAGGSSLKPGDRVTVVSGPFRWVDALFERRLNGRGRVRVLLNLVHGSAALEVEADAIRPLKMPAAPELLRATPGASRSAAGIDGCRPGDDRRARTQSSVGHQEARFADRESELLVAGLVGAHSNIQRGRFRGRDRDRTEDAPA